LCRGVRVVKVGVTHGSWADKMPSLRNVKLPRCPLPPTTTKSSLPPLFSGSANMRVLSSFVTSLLLSGATIVSAASSWSFEDATVSVTSKGAGVGGGAKDK
jgi:hypothetical protein